MPVPVACANTVPDPDSDERQGDDGAEQTSGHATPPMNHAETARRSSPASKPYSRNVSATRALSMGVLV